MRGHSAEFNGPFGVNLIANPLTTLDKKLSYFRSQVGTKKPFDIKQPGRGFSREDLKSDFAIYDGQIMKYDDFGNYNYGVAAAAFGIPLQWAIWAAGYNQTVETMKPDWSNPEGAFDIKRDTENIIKGYNHVFK